MSRCFPFPPPGYEKEARTDDIDLLTKEKKKDKKHKKEDKKREGEEKKDKERSKDKRREKKDRKEKHRDKKKDKDRDKDKSKISDEKKIEGRLEGYNGGKPGENSQQARENMDSKFVEEFGRRLGDEERGPRKQMVENFTGTAQRRAEATARVVDKDFDDRFEGKENVKDKKGYDRKMDGQGNKSEERSLGFSIVQNFIGMDQRTAAGMARPMDKNDEKRVEGKEKKKDKEGNNKQGDRHKDRDGENKSKGKDKNRDKKKEKEEKGNHKNKKQDKVRESGKNAHMVTLSTDPFHIPKDSNKSASVEGNVRKRKGFEMNGFIHENELRPNKLPRPTALSSHPFTENGRKLEPCQIANQHASVMLVGGNNNLKASKEHKVNGIIEAQPSSVDSTRSSFTTVLSIENGEASTKPPHPDSKYLSQILSVPKMEEWSDFDDQEWLFSGDSLQLKKPKLVSSSGVEETSQVWDKGQWIESADVCALPYVIPY